MLGYHLRFNPALIKLRMLLKKSNWKYYKCFVNNGEP